MCQASLLPQEPRERTETDQMKQRKHTADPHPLPRRCISESLRVILFHIDLEVIESWQRWVTLCVYWRLLSVAKYNFSIIYTQHASPHVPEGGVRDGVIDCMQQSLLPACNGSFCRETLLQHRHTYHAVTRQSKYYIL